MYVPQIQSFSLPHQKQFELIIFFDRVLLFNYY
jgi:hypothetical protein